MDHDPEYGIEYSTEMSTRTKDDQSAEHFGHREEHERVFIRSHIYGGSSERLPTNMTVFDMESGKVVQKSITTPSCLRQCYKEILDNAKDNSYKSRNQGVDPGSITITMEEEVISIENGGLPIPVLPHPDMTPGGKFYDGTIGTVVDLTFGNIGAGSNLSDNYARQTGGQNGIGAKLVNVLSREFEVVVGDNIRGVIQRAKWIRNMCTKVYSICEPAYVYQNGQFALDGPPYTGPNFVRITWKQDFRKFGAPMYTREEFELYMKYAIDASFTCKVPVFFNGTELKYQDINRYAGLIAPESIKNKVVLYSWDQEPQVDKKEFPKLIASGQLRPVVEMCILDTPDKGFHISFTNGIHNTTGGVHTNECYKTTLALIKTIMLEDKTYGMTKEDLDKLDIRTMKKHSMLIINYNCLNPQFTSQAKDQLSAPTPKISLSSDSLKSLKTWKIMDKIYEAVSNKKRPPPRKGRIVDDNFKDANFVGRKGHKPILIFCEGKSAGAYVDVFILNQEGGYDLFAKFPSRGKIKNVSDLSIREMDVPVNGGPNELTKLMEAVGLQDNVDYRTKQGQDSLRYKYIWVMVDADSDGSHILCLLINFLFRRFPTFLQAGLLFWVITPVIRIVDNHERTIERFYNVSDYEAWRQVNPDTRHSVDYFKGLASASPAQAKEDSKFSPIPVIAFDDEAETYLQIAFNQKMGDSDRRKQWILFYRDWINNPIVQGNSVRAVDIINTKLVEYSLETLPRALVSYKDSHKLSQRQLVDYILNAYNFGKSEGKKMKTVQMANAAAEKCHYQHGDLTKTLLKLALDYAGESPLPILANTGMFGSRPNLGKDCGAGRYISSKPDFWIKFLIRKEIYNLIPKAELEGHKVQAKYIPWELPLAIINGTKGISTGWSATIPSHHPLDVKNWCYRYLSGMPVFPMMPWFKYFTGNVVLEQKTKKHRKSKAELENGDDSLPDTYEGLTCRTEGIYQIQNVRSKEITVEKEDPTTGKKVKAKEIIEICDILINEVPINIESNKLMVSLGKCSEEAPENKSRNTMTPTLLIKGYRGIPEAKDIGMISRMGMNNITAVDDEGIPITFPNIYGFMASFCDNISNLFMELKNKRIKELHEELDKMSKKLFLVTKSIDGEFVFFNQEDNVINGQLDAYQITYELFDSIKPRQFTQKGKKELENKIEEKSKELQQVIDRDHLQDWRDDMDKFESEIRKHPEFNKLHIHEFPLVECSALDLIEGRIMTPYIQIESEI